MTVVWWAAMLSGWAAWLCALGVGQRRRRGAAPAPDATLSAVCPCGGLWGGWGAEEEHNNGSGRSQMRYCDECHRGQRRWTLKPSSAWESL